jgi:23S rRNA pseudouridine2604 synthase
MPSVISPRLVSVDGAVAEDPATASRRNKVSSSARRWSNRPVTILMHKPAGIEIEAAFQKHHRGKSGTQHGRGKPFRTAPVQTTAATLLETTAFGPSDRVPPDFRVIRKLLTMHRATSPNTSSVDGQIADKYWPAFGRMFKASWQASSACASPVK